MTKPREATTTLFYAGTTVWATVEQYLTVIEDTVHLLDICQ